MLNNNIQAICGKHEKLYNDIIRPLFVHAKKTFPWRLTRCQVDISSITFQDTFTETSRRFSFVLTNRTCITMQWYNSVHKKRVIWSILSRYLWDNSLVHQVTVWWHPCDHVNFRIKLFHLVLLLMVIWPQVSGWWTTLRKVNYIFEYKRFFFRGRYL